MSEQQGEDSPILPPPGEGGSRFIRINYRIEGSPRQISYTVELSDRLVGHSMSVDTLLKLDEDTLISGSEDGVIRLVGILPNRIIQPLAEHSEYPIENLAFSCDRKYLGSISHDQILKLWDLEELLSGNQPEPNIQQVEADSDDSDDTDMDLISSPPVEGSSRGNVRRNRPFNSSAANFFADL